MSPRLPPLIDATILPEPVLRAAVLDGELVAVGEAYRVVDLPVDPLARARSIAAHATGDRVIAERSAAWVWGAIADLPVPCTTVRSPAATAAHTAVAASPGTRVRVVGLATRDVVDLGGVPVTTPLRTALDLSCGERFEADVVRALLAHAAATPADLGAELRGRGRRHGGRRALQRLQVLVTR